MTTLPASSGDNSCAPARAGGRRCAVVVVLLLVSIVVGVCLSLFLGEIDCTPMEAVRALFGHGEASTLQVVRTLRLPRALCALLVGANLAVAGALLQSVTRNPLADPGIVGLTSGAGVAATVVLAAAPGLAALLPPFAFVGALVSSFVVYVVSWRPGQGASPMRMVLAGVAVNAVFFAVIGVLITLYPERVPTVMFWTAGSFNGRGWSDLRMIVPYSVVGIVVALLLRRSVRMLELGDDTAMSLGVAVERTRLIAFAAAALLAGAAVSIAGLVGFIGLVVPHLIRIANNSGARLLPMCALAGGALLLWSDLVARLVVAPHELPVGVVTSLLGGPYFIVLLCRSEWLR